MKVNILAISISAVNPINRLFYNKLHESGFNIHLIIPKEIETNKKRVVAYPHKTDKCLITVLPIKGNNHRTYWFPGIIDQIKQVKPNYIYLDNDPISVMALNLAYLSSIFRFKLVIQTNENMSPTDILKNKGFRGLAFYLTRNILHFMIKDKIFHIFSINLDGVHLYRSLGYQSVSKIPLGFDPDIFKVDNKARARIRTSMDITSKIAIAYFGRMIENKGIHLLLEVLSDMQEIDWVLILDHFSPSSTKYQNLLKSLIKKNNLENSIKYIDVDHFEIADYMNAADIVVIPSLKNASWNEQYGRVAAESLACGKMVVASDSGELPNIIGKNGIIFKSNNKNDLLRAINLAIKKVKDNHLGYFQDAAIYAQSQLSINKQIELFKLKSI